MWESRFSPYPAIVASAFVEENILSDAEFIYMFPNTALRDVHNRMVIHLPHLHNMYWCNLFWFGVHERQ